MREILRRLGVYHGSVIILSAVEYNRIAQPRTPVQTVSRLSTIQRASNASSTLPGRPR